MNNDLLSVFLEQELNGPVRELLAGAVKDFKASGRQVAIRSFEFNCFDVVLDFEHGTVTLGDILSAEIGSEQIISLNFFLEACGLS